MKKLFVMFMCITILVSCTTNHSPYQGVAQSPETEGIILHLENNLPLTEADCQSDAEDTVLSPEDQLSSEADYQSNAEDDMMHGVSPPAGADWSHQTTMVFPYMFAFKLERLLSPSDYGGVFTSYRNDDAFISVWTVNSVAVDNAIQATYDYFQEQELVPFEVILLEARASLEQFETLSAQIREIELEGNMFQFLTPLIEQEHNRLKIHGAVLSESHIRNQIGLLIHENGLAIEAVTFDFHDPSETAFNAPITTH
ncbi:MAG: hypothetical protein FWE32_10625 [Oscillospiraceae bacterium]|nr:hypothetical protein [Oscillospiraceae bacterium]